MSGGEAPPIAGRFLIQIWPEGSVVFDRHFGNTHAMDEFTSAVFGQLNEHPDVDQTQLCQRLSPQWDRPGMEITLAVEQALQHLSAHGLIRKRP